MPETALEEKVEFREYTPRQELFLATSLRQARLELSGQEEAEDPLRGRIREFIASYPQGITSLSRLSAEDIEAYVKERLSGREYLHFDKLLTTVTKLSNFAKEELASQVIPEEIVEQIEAEGEVIEREVEDRVKRLGFREKAKDLLGKLHQFMGSSQLRLRKGVLVAALSLALGPGVGMFQQITRPLTPRPVAAQERIVELSEEQLAGLELLGDKIPLTTTDAASPLPPSSASPTFGEMPTSAPTPEETVTAEPLPTATPTEEPTATAPPPTTAPIPTATPTEAATATAIPEPTTPPAEATVEAGIKEEEREIENPLLKFYRMIEEYRKERAEKDPDYLHRIDQELNRNRINFYFIGTDLAQGNRRRADAIVVASYDLVTRNLFLMRIPRDLHAPEASRLERTPAVNRNLANRINSITVFGGETTYAEDMRRTLEDATGLSMDLGAYTEFEGFKHVVGWAGGVEIEISEDFVSLYAEKYRVDRERGQQGLEGELKPGMQRLGVNQALWYARQRYEDSDYQRGNRQLEVVRAVAKALWERFKREPHKITGDILTDLPSLHRNGNLQLAADFSFTDLRSLMDVPAFMRHFVNRDLDLVSEYDFFAPWSGLIGNIPGSFQTTIRGGKPNAENPVNEYWYPLRNALANHLRAQTP